MQAEIFNGNGVLPELQKFVQQLEPSAVFVLTDSNTSQHCWPVLHRALAQTAPIHHVQFEAGEPQKTLETCTAVWQFLLENGADRKSVLINLGGGVVTDLGAFVAATFMRGIKFIQVPTSLLAMVDASVGGKTGVDFYGAKNQIGTFTEPNALFIVPKFLKTLPSQELVSGWAEVLKHGLIKDRAYWALCEDGPALTKISAIINRSVSIKKAVVETDLKESGQRKILNFGHTIGHALESFFLSSGSPITHGRAVAAGMQMAAKLSVHISGLPADDFEAINQRLNNLFGTLPLAKADVEHIVRLMKHDKKNVAGSFKFVLLKAIGQAVFDVSVSPQQVQDVLHWYIKKQSQL